jgi:hypothetical protein
MQRAGRMLNDDYHPNPRQCHRKLRCRAAWSSWAGPSFLFSNDLALERYDDSTPGSGLPQDEASALQAHIQDSWPFSECAVQTNIKCGSKLLTFVRWTETDITDLK